MTKCEYCNRELDYEVTACSYCGAPCPRIPRPKEEVQPQVQIIEKHTTEKIIEKIIEKPTAPPKPQMNIDVSFIKENQKKREVQSWSGVAAVGVIILVLIVIIASCAA